jgi:hypothetical protein
MKIRCKNKKCIEANNGKPYEWNYKGENPFYAPCPRCKGSVKLNNEEKNDK